MKIEVIDGVRSTAELEEHLRTRGCYSEAENLRIYRKWFSLTRPRDRLMSTLQRRYRLDRKVLCDVGSSYGMHILFGARGSYGIELERYEVAFARAIGLEVHERDLLADDLSDLPRAEVVWAGAVIEHLDSPHIFLRQLHRLLAPGGLVIVETPRKPAFRWMERAPLLRRVYGDHDDHVNAFSDSSLCFFCERAGFELVELLRWSKPLVNRLSWLPPLASGRVPFRPLANGAIYVGRKIDGWEYGPRATRRVAENPRGFEYVGQPFPEEPPG